MKQRPISDSTAAAFLLLSKVMFLWVAAGCFIVAFFFAAWNIYQISTFASTTGIISSVSVRKTTGKGAATYYDYRVDFQTSKGVINAQAGSSVFYSPFEEGEAVRVYYNPVAPEEAFVNSFGTIWFLPAVLFLAGLFPLIVANPSVREFKALYQKVFNSTQPR